MTVHIHNKTARCDARPFDWGPGWGRLGPAGDVVKQLLSVQPHTPTADLLAPWDSSDRYWKERLPRQSGCPARLLLAVVSRQVGAGQAPARSAQMAARFLSSVTSSVTLYMKVDEATSNRDEVTPGAYPTRLSRACCIDSALWRRVLSLGARGRIGHRWRLRPEAVTTAIGVVRHAQVAVAVACVSRAC